jgi:hypothetical protein
MSLRFEPASRRKGDAVRNDVPEGPILDEAECPGGALTRSAPRPHQLEVLVSERYQDRPELLQGLDRRAADRRGPAVDEHPLAAADPRPRDEREGVVRSPSRVRLFSVLGSERCPSWRASSPA